MNKSAQHIRNKLLEFKNEKNQIFVAKLIPNIPSETIIGIKTAQLRALAKEITDEKIIYDFLNTLPHYYLEENTLPHYYLEENTLPHYYLEENNLHGFFIERIKDFEICIELTEKFLPFIDNWATCDSYLPKIFKKYPKEVYAKINIWIKSDKPFTVRYAIGLLLSNYLDNEFKEEMLELVANVQCNEYYVQMMQAWYFATALAKQKIPTLTLLKKKKLSPFVQNKSIQKVRESRRISEELKEEIRLYKI